MQFPGLKVFHVGTFGVALLLSAFSSVLRASSSVSLVSGIEASREVAASSSNAQATYSSGASTDSVIIVIGPWPEPPVVTLSGFSIRHQFAGPDGDGAHPVSLVPGKDGSLYGSTRAGGANDAGTIFKLAEPGNLLGKYSLLHSFEGSTGGWMPVGSLVAGTDGNIYGATANGGVFNYGTIFRVTPAGDFQVLHSFGAGISEGTESIVSPMSLMQASDGNFYGLAADTVIPGFAELVGTLRRAFFRMSPDGEVTVVGRCYVPARGVVTSTGYTPDVSRIVEGTDGGIYFVSDARLYRFDPQGGELVEVVLPAGLSLPGNLLRANDGNIYSTANSDAGTVLFRIASADGTVTQLPGTLKDLPSPLVLPPSQAVSPPPGAPTALFEGSNGTIYGVWSRSGASYMFSAKPAANQGPQILWRFPDSAAGEHRSLFMGGSGYVYGITNGSAFGSLFSCLPYVAPNRAPIARDDQFQVSLSSSGASGAISTRILTANLLANDSDPDNESLSVISVTTNAPGATVELGLNGTIKVSQTDGFRDSVEVNYTIADTRGATASAKAVFQYIAPVAVDDLFRVGSSSRGTSIPVLNNDTSVNSASLVITRCSNARYGRVSIAEDGKSLRYKPGPLYRDRDSFEYTISDGYGGTATAKVHIQNPFLGLKGEYYGLISYPKAGGSVRLLMSPTGAFTGALYYGGQVFRFRGQLSTDGHFQIPISTKSSGRIMLHVNAGRGQTPRIDGVLEGGAGELGVVIFSASSSRVSARAPDEIVGRYTVALPSDPKQAGPYYPQGDGFALLAISAKGTAKVTGRLGDGAAFSAGSLLLADGSLPFYLDAYTKRAVTSGGVSGKLRFVGTEESDVSGELIWIKPRQSGGAYAGGFRGRISAVGSRWTPPAQLAYQDPFWRGGAMLHMGEGDLPDKIKKRVEFSTGADLVLSPAGADQMQLQLDPLTGFLGGNFIHRATRTTHSIQGVILQKQRSGAGLFAGKNTTGWVVLEPRD